MPSMGNYTEHNDKKTNSKDDPNVSCISPSRLELFPVGDFMKQFGISRE
jgi:hypothetical protein